MTVVTPTAAMWEKNKHTNKQIEATHRDLTTSRASIVLRHSGRRSPDKSDKRAGAVTQPRRFLNKQTESKFPGTFETLAHAAFGSLLLFHVNSFEESFLSSPSTCTYIHTLLLACNCLGFLILRTPYPIFPGYGLSDGVPILIYSFGSLW